MTTNSESGMTLVELLVAGAIAMAITGLMGTAIFQFFTVTNQGNDVMTAMHQVQNAGHWVNLDGQMSSSASGGTELNLTLPDSSSITYALLDNELRRTSGGSELTVARDISDVNFSVDGRVITMSIISSPNDGWDISEQATYKVCLRPEEGGG